MSELGGEIRRLARGERDFMLSLLEELVSLESPSDDVESQGPVQERLSRSLSDLGFLVRRIPGRRTVVVLYTAPRKRVRGRVAQLLLGHSDTVWPRGTLETMPLREEGGRLMGPGVFDMKGGLVQMVVALRILRTLGLEPPLTPVVLVNSDEEIGSPESGRVIRRLARRVVRAFIPEPSMGPEGRVKTTRKGWSRFTLKVTGRAAHAGLDPEGGASAILELAHLIQALHAMTDLEEGVTVNVGVIRGGSRSNVIAPEASAEVDIRVLRQAQAREVEEAIRSLDTTVPGTSLEVVARGVVPPLEPTPGNRALWDAARKAARDVGLTLEETTAGGGSDGNTTSLYTPTLDGIGAVGDGAHAPHEFLFVDRHVERCALLARLLLLDP